MSGTKHVLTFLVELSPIVDVGETPAGLRRMVPITGGTVTGAFEARVLPGGADFQTVLPSGTLEIEAHYILETTDGERIEVSSVGLRAGSAEVLAKLGRGESVPPEQYYFRTAIRLRTASKALAHLNDRLYVSHGQRERGAVKLLIHEVL